ncbi:MAG: 50S ribosomal protein L3 [Anaerolineales bacterium]
MKGLIGKKVGMTQLFDDSGKAVPVTVIKAGPCYVTQVRTLDQDGYSAVQLGYEETKPQRLTGGELGHLKKHNLPSLRFLREFRTDEVLEEGEKLTVEVFAEGERVDIVGKSKGRGFAGVVKRYGFSGGPKTHGQSDRQRAPGSIGAGSTPGRVFKGKRMPGRMGNDTVTSQNLLISRIDPENDIIAVRGSVPGPKDGLVIIKEARKQ